MSLRIISPDFNTEGLFLRSLAWGYRNLTAADLAIEGRLDETDEQVKVRFLKLAYANEVKLFRKNCSLNNSSRFCIKNLSDHLAKLASCLLLP